MKNIFAMILALTLVLSLCACDSDEPIRGEQIDSNATEFETPIDEVTEAPSISLGETSGLTYESKFIGIGCTLPEGWSFYTDEQIMEMNNFTMDMAGEDFQEAVENATIVYDMMAIDSSGMNSISVNLEKVDPLQLVLMDLATNLENSIPLIQSSLESIGCTDVVCTVGKVTIEDREIDCVYTTSNISGLELNQCTISIKCNGYLASISVAAFGEETLNQLLDCIYLLK